MKKAKILDKYNVSTPRYTSYPAVPYWKNNIDQNIWIKSLEAFNVDDGVDLYIHIPYCHKLCWYCGCNRSISRNQEKIKEYLMSVLEEWEIYRRQFKGIKIKSIHFGGGTPNSISSENLNWLLTQFSTYFTEDFFGAAELDPRILSRDFLSVLKKFNFTRVSFGIQDFDPTVQKAINRVQPFKLVKEKTELIRELNFQSLNFDLIYGLPKQSLNSITQTLQYVDDLRPDLLALYSYAHLPKQLANQRLIEDRDLPPPEKKVELYQSAKKGLENIGYVEIGMDHFARKDSFLYQALLNRNLSRNFMGYTDKKGDVLIGLGASSISAHKGAFIQNSKVEKDYVRFISEGVLPITKGHLLNPREIFESDIISDIMCYGSVATEKISRVGTDLVLQRIRELLDDGIVRLDDESLRATEIGKPFLRNIAFVFDSFSHIDTSKLSRFSSTA